MSKNLVPLANALGVSNGYYGNQLRSLHSARFAGNPAIVGQNGGRFEVRRQALKLRFWDERHLHIAGMLFDHSYESIKGLPNLGIHELRLDDEIGGQSNIRVVFFDPPPDWQPVVGEARPLRVVWVLEALPKRRNHWTVNDLTRFRASRLLIQKRFYGR